MVVLPCFWRLVFGCGEAPEMIVVVVSGDKAKVVSMIMPMLTNILPGSISLWNMWMT